MAGEPVQGGRRYLIGSFYTAAAYITGFIKPSIEPPSGMTFSKSADRSGPDSSLAE